MIKAFWHACVVFVIELLRFRPPHPVSADHEDTKGELVDLRIKALEAQVEAILFRRMREQRH